MSPYQSSIDHFRAAMAMFQHAKKLGFQPTSGAIRMNTLQAQFVEEAAKPDSDPTKLDTIMAEVGIVQVREEQKPEDEQWFIQVAN